MTTPSNPRTAQRAIANRSVDRSPPPIDLLVKPTGPICNLGCSYCFFLSRQVLFPGDRFRMSDELLDEYVRQLLDAQQGPTVTVSWQGGEPTLMGLDFFERSVELIEQHRRPDQRVRYAIQTNATLLTTEWADFFEHHRFLVGVSVDGPRHLHDRYRSDTRGGGTFDRVLAGFEHIRGRKIDCNILCTVNAANQHHPLEVYRFLRDTLEATHMQFIPVVERVTAFPLEPSIDGRTVCSAPGFDDSKAPVTSESVDADLFGRFLIEVFNEWIQNDVGTVHVQHFDVALAAWHGRQPGLCVFAETCGNAPTLIHSGDVYSCDFYVDPAHKLGNITETALGALVAGEQQQAFGRSKRSTLPQHCLDCNVRFACNGGCPKDRFIETPEGEAGLNYLCTGYKAFFEHIDTPMRLMSDFLSMGLPAASIMELAAVNRGGR